MLKVNNMDRLHYVGLNGLMVEVYQLMGYFQLGLFQHQQYGEQDLLRAVRHQGLDLMMCYLMMMMLLLLLQRFLRFGNLHL